jgi:hypothetical protein
MSNLVSNLWLLVEKVPNESWLFYIFPEKVEKFQLISAICISLLLPRCPECPLTFCPCAPLSFHPSAPLTFCPSDHVPPNSCARVPFAYLPLYPSIRVPLCPCACHAIFFPRCHFNSLLVCPSASVPFWMWAPLLVCLSGRVPLCPSARVPHDSCARVPL